MVVDLKAREMLHTLMKKDENCRITTAELIIFFS